MTFLEVFSLVLVVSGGIILFIAFTNQENITGLWVAGDIQRDKQFIDAGRFRKRAYLIFRLAGVLMFLSGCAIMIFDK